MHDSFGTACIECLEDRRLFAGFVFSHHLLRVVGSADFRNVITVGLTPDGNSVQAEIVATTPKRIVTFLKTFPLSDVIRKVSITGGSGDDLITIDQTNGSFPIPCVILGAARDDTIAGGDEPDTIFGGTGNDSLSGGGGNDALYGQKGNDTLFGGPGNDFLNGGQGEDSLSGDDGNDTLVDFEGPDSVFGGTGGNTFYLPSLKLDHHNDYTRGKDKFHYVTKPADPSSDTSTSILGSLFPVFNL